MEIEHIQDIEAIKPYKDIWKEILVENDTDILFVEYEWILKWWEFFGDQHELFVLVIKSGKEVTGICPLMTTQRGLYKELSFIGCPKVNYMDFIIRDKDRNETLAAIIHYLVSIKGSVLINLRWLFNDSPNYKALIKLLHQNRIKYYENKTLIYYRELKNMSFEKLFQEDISRKTRNTVRYKERKLRILGNIEYGKVDIDHLDKIFEIHNKRWEKRIDTSHFSSKKNKQFIKELLLHNTLSDKVIINTLSLNKKIIAFVFGFLNNGRYLGSRVGHDNSFSICSIGQQVIVHRLKECFDKGIRIFDMATGYEDYKTHWSNKNASISAIIFTSKGILPRLISLKMYLKKKLRFFLKRYPSLVYWRRNVLGDIRYFLSKEHLSKSLIKLNTSVRDYGCKGIFKNLYKRIEGCIWLKREYLILKKNLEESIEERTLEDNIILREATIEDLDIASNLMHLNPNEIVRRFYKKHKCYLLINNEEIIHYAWVEDVRITIPHIHYNLNIEKNSVYIYDVFTKRKYGTMDKKRQFFKKVLNQLYESYDTCYVLTTSSDQTWINLLEVEKFEVEKKIKVKRVFNKTVYVNGGE